jgi:threonyl-tRNA synthetase
MILEYIADENRIQPILVEVPGKEDEHTPTIHLARVGQNHYHAGIPVALHSRNAHPASCSPYHSHALPIATNSSGRAYNVGNTRG